MTSLGLDCVVIFLTFLAGVGGAYEGPLAYYWSRTKTGTDHVSRRAHIGPLPYVNDLMTEWAPWGSWATCSRSCGGGVRSRTRACVAKFPRVMPGSGIRTSHDHCLGSSVQYGVCGAKVCSGGEAKGPMSFRAAQCRHYNNRRVFGRLVNNWVPYMQGDSNPCSLVCEGEGQAIIYTFGKVTDGTHCTADRDGLCVNGRCLALSCDGRLGGAAREDMCRVCGGRNDTCTHHVGVFHNDPPTSPATPPTVAATPPSVAATPPYVAATPLSADLSEPPQQLVKSRTRAQRRRLGYFEVTKIPPGATNVLVRDKSPNFLALKADGKYLLNGDWLIDWPGEVEAAGSTFTYSRGEDESETLTALGPTREALTLMVLLREHNPGIYFEYWIPNQPTTTTTTTTPPQPAALVLTTTSTHHHHTPQRRTYANAARIVKSLNGTLRSAKGLSSVDWRRGRGRGGGGGRRPNRDPSIWSRHRHENESFKVPKKDYRKIGRGKEEKEEEGIQDRITSRSEKKKRREEKKMKMKRKKKKKKRRKKNGKKWRKKKEEEEEEEEGRCPPCKRSKRKAKEIFCLSDFVSRVQVVGVDVIAGQTRYEVLVHQSYKNTVPLLHKEYLWAPDACGCPQLRRGTTYLVMGLSDTSKGREVRLVLGRDSYVKRFHPRHLKRILRVRQNEMRFCRPWRRDLSHHAHIHAHTDARGSDTPSSSSVVGVGGSGGSGGENSVLVKS